MSDYDQTNLDARRKAFRGKPVAYQPSYFAPAEIMEAVRANNSREVIRLLSENRRSLDGSEIKRLLDIANNWMDHQ